MSRDRERPHGKDAGKDAAKTAERDAELLTAYVDGVAELPGEERHAVETRLAGDPAARADAAAVQGLLGRLRALPPSDGDEPDWAAMERSIRQAVDAVPPRPWWRRWQWLVPAMTCATAAAVLVVLWPRTPAVAVTVPGHPPVGSEPRPVAPPIPEALAADDDFALWLDGRVVDVDPGALRRLAAEPAPASAELPVVEDVLGDVDPAGVPPDAGSLLPASDLAWLDALDDAALDRAERWLARPAPAESSGSPHLRYRKKS
jgi:anti-sigma factor RsiW